MKKFHNNIFSLLIFLFITATISILLIMWLNLSDAIEKLAINKLNEITEKTVTKLDAYFDAIRADLLQMKELSDNGMLDAENNMNMNYLLMPVYNTAPQITTFAIARSNGDEFSLIREDSTWLNNFVYETDSGMNIIRERWIGDYMDRIVIRQWEDYNAGYDPRTRDWYKGASALFETSPVYWTNPYKILFQTFPGITAATKAKSKKSGEYNIVQWDILLSDISEFTRQLAFSENGRVFLLSENNEVLGLPADKRFENTDSLRKYVLLHYDSAGYIPMSCAMHSEHEQAKPFPFMINVSAWWGCISKYELDNGRHFLIGVVVPESDFLSDIKRTRNIIFGCSILITIFIIVVAKGYFDKRKANRILIRQKAEIEQQKEEIETQRDHIEIQKEQLEVRNEELTQAKEEIETQRDEIEAQRDLVVSQKDLLEITHKEITDSIRYAKRIQEAILPTREVMDKLLKDYFVLFLPRDIVSGDFYWMTEVEGKVIIAVADCTGHGVPGAFMSMLGAAFLNEVVNNEYITHTGVILRKLRKKVVKALQQTGEAMEQKDGMDIAICCIDFEEMTLQFSGANNPLYLIRNSMENPVPDAVPLICEVAVLYELKADKMPIAIYEKMDRFTDKTVQLADGDCIFLLSDGYPDQFGGPKGKKFKYTRLKNVLVENAATDIKYRKKLLHELLEEWTKGIDPLTGLEYEQVDDITILGLKI